MNCEECRYKIYDHYVEGSPCAVYTCGYPDGDASEGCPLDGIDNSAKTTFAIACDRCGRAVELNNSSIEMMAANHTAMIMKGSDMFRTYPINLNFGNAGGYGVVEFRCKCGNELSAVE